MHTAGPWVVSATGRYVRYQGMHGPNVCDLDNFGGPKEEGAANASLIAAAPELLSALEGLLAALVYADGEGLVKVSEADEANAARLAIAKAKGVKP